MFLMPTERIPSITLHKNIGNANSGKQKYGNKSKSSKSSEYRRTNNAESIFKLWNSHMKIKKAFTTLNTRSKRWSTKTPT